jgi:hypothetical protein
MNESVHFCLDPPIIFQVNQQVMMRESHRLRPRTHHLLLQWLALILFDYAGHPARVARASWQWR